MDGPESLINTQPEGLGSLIRKTLPDGQVIEMKLGDINGDGEIDQDDLELLRLLVSDSATGHFLLDRMSAEELLTCDINQDGFINQTDLALLCNSLIVRLEEQALTDELTGLLNRRGFKDKAFLKIQSAKRFNTPLTCIAIDIDHFKDINDDFGHDVGDMVLRQLANRLTKTTRFSDAVSRYGGEEFMILLDNAALETGMAQAEKMMAALRKTPIVLPNPEREVTVSMGVTDFHPDLSFYQFIKHADVALYKAKNQGRNQICVYQDERT